MSNATKRHEGERELRRRRKTMIFRDPVYLEYANVMLSPDSALLQLVVQRLCCIYVVHPRRHL